MKNKKFKPLIGYLENDKFFVDAEFLEKYRKYDSWRYNDLISRLGKDVFLFDVNSCEYVNKKREKIEVNEITEYSVRRVDVDVQ